MLDECRLVGKRASELATVTLIPFGLANGLIYTLYLPPCPIAASL